MSVTADETGADDASNPDDSVSEAPTPETESESTYEEDRATRLARRRGRWRRRAVVTSVTLVVILAGAAGTYAAVANSQPTGVARADDSTLPAPSTTRSTTSTTRAPTTTTSTIPKVIEPKDEVLPDPGNGIRQGNSGASVLRYEARLKALHFDPGKIDGYFDQDMQYAVSTLQKYVGLPRTGVIDVAADFALTHFRYTPAEPKSEPDRVEIDLDKQTITVYANWQPQLLTTTSTGNGEHFCGGVDGCQYAITPVGHFRFYELHRGWQKGKLGTMWNPYYFNGSIAVHGLASVPNYPASHGCARIPMHVADYFHTLVHHGESVFVFGTPKRAGNGYVGPAPTAAPATVPTTASTTTTTAPPKTTTTTVKPKTTTTTVKPKVTTSTT